MGERYQEALNRIPAPGAGCHAALLGAANMGVIAGLSDGQIFGDIRASIPAGDRRVSDREITDAISKARREVIPSTPSTAYKPTPRPTPRPLIDGQATRNKLIQAGDGAGQADLWELSPIRPDWEPGYHDAVAVLSLYDDAEWLYLGDQYGKEVKPVSEWRGIIEGRQVAPMPHIMPNPVDGQAHDIGNGKTSFRCDDAVKSFRYAIVEFDTLTKPEQFAFWYSILTKKLLDVAVLLDSGGKSIHGWVRVTLPDRQAWEHEIGTRFYGAQGVMTSMGADRACRNPSRLSRLAGHYRAEKKNWQTLLYLNPKREAAQ
jgi:hypothetical protein